MSGQDEVFGLPFLFTGGLPNSLEKFTEGNLRCFLIYLIEVVGKANRQNVWQKPAWWRSKLIPYSPISVDTTRIPPEQVLKELRGLIESCYRYYKAEKILEVSRQLAEIPRILLGIRDNKDNTMTVYDTNSKAVYVTIRPENLYYDAKSLNKVSKDWRSNYTKEDVTFCEIKKASKKRSWGSIDAKVIEVSDSDEDNKGSSVPLKDSSGNVGKWEVEHEECFPSKRVPSPWRRLHHMSPSAKKNSRKCAISNTTDGTMAAGIYEVSNSLSDTRENKGVVIRSGSDVVIALSDDSDNDDEKVKPCIKTDTYDPLSDPSSGDKDVEFVCEFNFSRPCPKRFKKLPSVAAATYNPNVIILSDSEDDVAGESGICISSYTSLAKNYQSKKYYIESPTRNAQKSILGPLICSPRKDLLDQKVVLPPVEWPFGKGLAPPSASPKCSKTQLTPERVAFKGSGPAVTSNVARNLIAGSTPKLVLSDEEDVFKPTKEEIYLSKKKKSRVFSLPPVNIKHPDHTPLKITTQCEFLELFGLKENNCDELAAANMKTTIPKNYKVPMYENVDFVTLIRSLRGSVYRMPLEWIQVLSSSNHIILSKKRSRFRHPDPTHINYEPFCSTDKSFIEYNIKFSNASVGKERRNISRQGRRGTDKNAWTIEKWWLQSEEGSQRSKRASLRMLRSLCSGDHAAKPLDTLFLGTLAPKLQRLPGAVVEKSLYSTINLKDPLHVLCTSK